jgi:D-aminoacyl-tRNA deacylase
METFFSSNSKPIKGARQLILVAASRKDTAGVNIAKKMLENYHFKKTRETYPENPIYHAEINGKKTQLVMLNDEAVYAQGLLKYFPNTSLVVFLSRHSSQSGKPTLSVHAPGNFASAELGGLAHRLSIAPAAAMRDVLGALSHLKTEMKLNYEVSYECTHHGPSLDVPTMFVELGSSPKAMV